MAPVLAPLVEVSLLSLVPITGDPSLQLSLGLDVPPARTQVLLRANTPARLSPLSARSLFEEGDRFVVEWGGEVSGVARVRPVDGGPDAQIGLGYERFRLREGGDETEVANVFVGAGLGWRIEDRSDRLWIRPGVAAVWLLDDGDEIAVGEATTRYRWGFVTPELTVGAALR